MAKDLKPLPPTDDVIRRIAMEVGKQAVEHIESMYPAATEAVAWTSARTSIRNNIHNAIMGAVNAADEGRIEKYIEDNERHRRLMARMRRAESVDDVMSAKSDDVI